MSSYTVLLWMYADKNGDGPLFFLSNGGNLKSGLALDIHWWYWVLTMRTTIYKVIGNSDVYGSRDYSNNLPLGKWLHLGFVYNYAQGILRQFIIYYVLCTAYMSLKLWCVLEWAYII